jgi:tRNA (guanine-N7-)-methyltransferase
MHTHRDLIVEPIGLDVESLKKPVNWVELFGNDHPVEMEIGIGKGTYLTDQAMRRAETNFFGIEWARWFWRYASDRLRRNGCVNARTVRAEANFFLTEYVPDASLSVLHIYFPDPWPKARHHKRRLIQPKFMPIIERVLQPGGRLQVVTDHQGYFEENISPSLQGSGLQNIDYHPPTTAAEDEFVGTNFERKYRREGRPFYAISALKSSKI